MKTSYETQPTRRKSRSFTIETKVKSWRRHAPPQIAFKAKDAYNRKAFKKAVNWQD